MFGVRYLPPSPEGDLLPLRKRNGVPNPDPLGKPVELPAPPKPVGYVTSNFPANPVELPNATTRRPGYVNPMANAEPMTALPEMTIPEAADPALPTFSNPYEEMKWRGGIDYGGKGGDPMAAAEWRHMTRNGVFDPKHPTGKDRFREALLTGLYGALQGMAQTGTWQGALGGGAAGAVAGAVSPETGRRMTWEPQRQQMMQRKREDLQLQADETQAEALRAGLEGTRAKTKETVADMEIKKAKSKSDLDAMAQKMILEAALNQAQVENQRSQAGQHDAQANYYGVQAGERIAKLPGALKKQQADILLDQMRQQEIAQRIAESQAKTPWEIQRIKAQVDAEYAAAASARERAYGQRQQNEGGDMTEEEIKEFAEANGMTVPQAKRQLRGAGYLLPRPE